MANRLTQLDKAIQSIDDQIKVLQLAREHLIVQQKAKPARKSSSKPRLVSETA